MTTKERKDFLFEWYKKKYESFKKTEWENYYRGEIDGEALEDRIKFIDRELRTVLKRLNRSSYAVVKREFEKVKNFSH